MTTETYHIGIVLSFFLGFYVLIIDPNIGLFIFFTTKLAWIRLKSFVILAKLYPRLRYDSAIISWRNSRPSALMARIKSLERRVVELEKGVDISTKPEYNLNTYVLGDK